MDHEQRCAALYEAGTNAPGPIPDGLLVLGSDSCTLCKNSMRNNDYATATADGTPVTWIDIAQEVGLNKFYGLPGIAYDYDNDYATAAGKRLGGTPIFLWVREGKVSIGPLAGGELEEGGLERLRAVAAERLAAL